MTYLCGMSKSKNKFKNPEFEMVSFNLETGKC